MRLWSKGLGKLVLPFYLSKAEKVYPQDDFIVIEGRIVERKVNWPYRIRLFPDDMVTFTKLMVEDKNIIRFLKTQLGFKFVTFVLLRILRAFLLLPICIIELILKRR